MSGGAGVDPGGYSEHDRARRCAEQAKGSGLGGLLRPEHRGPFTRDRARVLHSAALRRLAGKTQVLGPDEEAEITGMPRTRLTHSLEVAQIGRGIAEELGADPDVVDTAGLAHDIGHPPFGHNGEVALDAAAAACGGFEGNAQTLRTLVLLEPKVDGAGLNLTRAGLDACVKYPWPASAARRGKYGVYTEDVAAFRWIRDGAPEGRRCLEAQVMDWADDVAYSVHDVEDGILAGRISLDVLADPRERAVLAGLAGRGFGADPEACEVAGRRLLALPVVARARELTARAGGEPSHHSPGASGPPGTEVAAQVALKRLTSELVSRFAAAAVDATRDGFGPGPLGRYRADLVVPGPVAAEVALLKAVAVRYVMADPARRRMQSAERRLLTELVAGVRAGAPDTLGPGFRESWLAAPAEPARLRTVIDQVAALTDRQAVVWHARLAGRDPAPPAGPGLAPPAR